MPGIASVAEAFEEFVDERLARPEQVARVKRIAEAGHGFEGWLKFEFYVWLIEKHQLAPGPKRDVGMEYSAAIDHRRFKGDIVSKRCDLWVRDADSKREGFHYIELKAPFFEWNRGKVLDSAGKDFGFMSKLCAGWERAVTGSAIVFGVGFNDEKWVEAREIIRRSAGVEAGEPPTGEGVIDQAIRWDVWTTSYPR